MPSDAMPDACQAKAATAQENAVLKELRKMPPEGAAALWRFLVSLRHARRTSGTLQESYLTDAEQSLTDLVVKTSYEQLVGRVRISARWIVTRVE